MKVDSPLDPNNNKLCIGPQLLNNGEFELGVLFKSRRRDDRWFNNAMKIQTLKDLFNIALMVGEKISIMDLQFLMQRATGELYVMDPGPVVDAPNQPCMNNIGTFACEETLFLRPPFPWADIPAALELCRDVLSPNKKAKLPPPIAASAEKVSLSASALANESNKHYMLYAAVAASFMFGSYIFFHCQQKPSADTYTALSEIEEI